MAAHTSVQHLDIALLATLFNVDALYYMIYSFILGATIYVSFIGGTLAYKTLPRQQFGALQAKSWPVHFGTTLVLDLVLLGLWTIAHPDVVPALFDAKRTDVAQTYALVFIALCSALNLFVVGPYTAKIWFERNRLERDEGKNTQSDSKEPQVSPELKSLNIQFGYLHAVSSLVNLGVFISLVFHGLWISTYGIQKY